MPAASLEDLRVRADRIIRSRTRGDCGCYSEQSPERVNVGCLSSRSGSAAANTSSSHGDTLLPASEPKQQRALTDAEIEAGLEKLSDTFRPIVAFTAETGFRISEVLGPVWSNCDLEAGSIVVEARLQKGKRRRTKTKRVREVSISEAAVEILSAHRRALAGSPALGLAAIAADKFVFVTKTGRPQSRRNVLRAWQEAVAIDGVGLHSLRHSFVSRLEEKGVSVAIAAELVGHSRVTTTQAVYTRMRGDRKAKLQAQRAALQAAAA